MIMKCPLTTISNRAKMDKLGITSSYLSNILYKWKLNWLYWLFQYLLPDSLSVCLRLIGLIYECKIDRFADSMSNLWTNWLVGQSIIWISVSSLISLLITPNRWQVQPIRYAIHISENRVHLLLIDRLFWLNYWLID